MDKLFGDLKGFFKSNKAITDSVVFRLHYRFTLVTLVAFSILVTGRQYIGDPIDCISRDDIPTELLDTFCWIHTTFSVDHAWHKKVGVEVPYPGVDKYVEGEKKIYHAYYQWVCFVLFLQAVLFYIPRYLWKHMEGHRMQNLVLGFDSPIMSKEDKDSKMKLLTEYFRNNLGNHRVYATSYIIAEIMNFTNVVGQIYLMDRFLGGEFTTYGSQVLAFTEWDWTLRYDPMIRVFPRMTKCTFHRYGSSGDVQKHDAMCLLPINIVNEKIYVFLWFWFVILAVLTGLELIYRAAIVFLPKMRLWVLFYRARLADRDYLEIVLNRCSKDDWLVLNSLCKNMDSNHFRDLIKKMADQLENEKFGAKV